MSTALVLVFGLLANVMQFLILWTYCTAKPRSRWKIVETVFWVLALALVTAWAAWRVNRGD